jgi:hypothetical protein
MTARRKRAMAGVDLTELKTNASDYQTEILEKDRSFLKKWMDAKPIEAFTSASVPATVGDHAKAFAKDAAKSVAWAAVGVKARYRRVETPTYAVLSEDGIRVFGTDVDGDLDGELFIDRATLSGASLREKEEKSPFVDPADRPKKYELVFETEGARRKIEFHDRLNTPPSLSAMTGAKGYFLAAAKNRVVGERFIEKLREKYPNLDANA